MWASRLIGGPVIANPKAAAWEEDGLDGWVPKHGERHFIHVDLWIQCVLDFFVRTLGYVTVFLTWFLQRSFDDTM